MVGKPFLHITLAIIYQVLILLLAASQFIALLRIPIIVATYLCSHFPNTDEAVARVWA